MVVGFEIRTLRGAFEAKESPIMVQYTAVRIKQLR
jgi:hypothetical protein